jgi:hypothetical protein
MLRFALATLSSLAGSVMIVSAQPITDADLQIATRQLKKAVDEMPQRIVTFPVYQDRRTSEQKQEMQKFSQAWAAFNPSIAPFLGKRQIINEHRIYPSRVQRRVCIIESYWQSETKHGVRFSTGTVKNGTIYTADNQLILRDRGYLGIMSRQGSNPQINVLPFPTPLNRKHPYDMVFNNPAIFDKFNKAECSTTLP